MENKFVIWGCGVKGKRVINFFNKEDILAFIDSNVNLQGKLYEEIPIISFEQYQNMYKDSVIIITPEKSKEIVNILEMADVYHYLLLEDCPAEMRGYFYSNDIVNRFPYELCINSKIYGIRCSYADYLLRN